VGLNDLPAGATPLDPDEAEGLRVPISTQQELNAFEAHGVLEAAAWALGNRRFLRGFLSDHQLRALHKRMFGSVWRWAGLYRMTQKSIGVESYRIGTEVRHLIADVEYWIANATYPPAEIAARFHHRLVQIHPFVNGNGRFARLATDLLCQRQGWPLSHWGAGDLVHEGDARDRYIRALKQADAHDIAPLVEFMAL